MRVHVYKQGSSNALTHADVAPTKRLDEIVELNIDERVYRVGSMEELALEATFFEIFGDESGHVIVHGCKQITISVSYAGAQVELEEHPSTQVAEVFTKAIRSLGIDSGSSVDLTLRQPGSSEDLDAVKPIGTYVPKGTCSLILDLVHIVRPQG